MKTTKRSKNVLLFLVWIRWTGQWGLHSIEIGVGSQKEIVSQVGARNNRTLQLGHQKSNPQFSFSLATKLSVISVNNKLCMIEKSSELWNRYVNCSQRHIPCPNCSISNIFCNCNVKVVYSIIKSVRVIRKVSFVNFIPFSTGSFLIWQICNFLHSLP